jgi:hypothetical protein
VSPCHIAAADRRLRDAFHHWRQLERTYFEPYEFRINLNSFVQEARNVTFILQKNKNAIPEFENWYSSWQQRMRDDPLMRWAVESRNRVTKQGDLETKSYSVVTFTADWTDERTKKFHGPPSLPSATLIQQALLKIPEEVIAEDALFCAERQWIDAALPGAELLSATSHVLLVLSDLLSAAHTYIQKVEPKQHCDVIESLDRMRHEYPLEIAQKEAARRVWVKARSREKLQYTVSAELVERTEISTQEIRERYGEPPELPKDTDTETLEGAVLMFAERAKQLLARDGHLEPVIFVKKQGDEGIMYLRLQMGDRAEKHIAIRQSAALLTNIPVEWAILINEAWWVPLEQLGEGVRFAVDSKNRREAISTVGVNAAGSFFNMRVPFRRFRKEIIFEKADQDSEQVNILLPILKAIRRDGTPTKPNS